MEDETKTTESKADFIKKAMQCDYNALWICQHPDQINIKCTKICKHFAIYGQKPEENA
jgi:hypothetical protein